MLAIPEKYGNDPCGSAPPTARDALCEWVTSRGSPGLAEWCCAQDIDTLRVLSELTRRDIEAAADPPPDPGEGFFSELACLATLMQAMDQRTRGLR